MPLNTVQQDFVNNAARPFLETLIRLIHQLETFIADYDALQAGAYVLPVDATILDDAGAIPRDDAPNLEGIDLATLRNIAANMVAQLSDPARQALIGKMVRDYATVTKG